MNQRGQFELQLWSDPNLVSVTRRFIEEVCERVIDDNDAVGRIALTAHELVENAVKYGSGDGTRVHIHFEPGEVNDHVVVTVSNSTTRDRVDELQAALAEIESAASPFAHYQALMRRNAKRSGSGLGLARICAEADMTLGLEFSAGLVSLSARGTVEKGGR